MTRRFSGVGIRIALAGLAVASSATIIACGAPGPSALPVASPPLATRPLASSSALSPQPSPPPSPAPSASGPEDTVPIDPALLDLLPAMVDGLPVVREDQGLADAVRDPDLRRNARAIAAGLVADPGSGEFAFASIVAFRPGVLTEAFYRDWRDTFDEGACSQAGTVTGHAEAEIGGRTVQIGSCSGGVRTYHVRLRNSDVVVSVSAVGDRRLGEKLVEGLRDIVND